MCERFATGLKRSIPANFSYFNVEFGMDGGYVHAIENPELFPQEFGKVPRDPPAGC